MDELAGALAASADEHLEPTWDAGRGEFTWGLGLGEEHPRGQYNAALAAAEAVTPGAWRRLATTTGGSRFTEPTVTGVDFPRVALSEAEWDVARGELRVTTAVQSDAVDGSPTSFRVSELGDPARWAVKTEGVAPVDVRVDGRELVVSTVACPQRFVLGPTREG